jgi:hypothetical protein
VVDAIRVVVITVVDDVASAVEGVLLVELGIVVGSLLVDLLIIVVDGVDVVVLLTIIYSFAFM